MQLQYSFNAFPNFANFCSLLLEVRWLFVPSVFWRWVGSLLLSEVISLTGTYIICKTTINTHNCLKTVKKQWKPCCKEPEKNMFPEQQFRLKTYVEEERWKGGSKQPALNLHLQTVGSAPQREQLGREISDKAAPTADWLQQVCWECMLNKSLGKWSRKDLFFVGWEQKWAK